MYASSYDTATAISTNTTMVSTHYVVVRIERNVGDPYGDLQRQIDAFARDAQKLKRRRPYWPANPQSTERPAPQLPRRPQPRILRVQARGG